MAEQEITRTENITIATVGENEYGDMLFTDTDGNDYKVGNKRVQFFKGKIEPGKTVQLLYTKAYDKEYIYSANLIKATPSPLPPEKIPGVTKIVKPQPEISGQEHRLSRNRSFALSYSKDLVVVDKIPVDKILSYAEVFVRWLDDEIKVVDEEVFSTLLKKTFNVVEKKAP